MILMSWNVNGLRAVVKKNFIDFLKKENPDILCLQEIRVQENQIPTEIMEIENYHKIWNFGERKGYSGVAIFTKEKPLKVSKTMDNKEFDREGRTLIAEYENFVLINSYFPNGQKNDERLEFKLKFYDRMLEIMNEIRQSGKNIIVCGDYNTAHKEIDLKNPKSNEKRSGFLPIERKWLDKIISQGYVDTFRKFNQDSGEYSWWSYRFNARKNNAGWRIDYFFVNQEFISEIDDAFIRQDIFGSDHCPVGIKI